MRPIFEIGLPNGLRWMEIDSGAEARKINRLSKMGVGYSYQSEIRACDKSGQEKPRYFVLMAADDDRIEVAVRVGSYPFGHSTADGRLVLGHDYSNPYPAFADEINALGSLIGRRLPPDSCPQARAELVQPAAGSALPHQVAGVNAIRQAMAKGAAMLDAEEMGSGFGKSMMPSR